MYCNNCGKELHSKAVVCVGCGSQIKALAKEKMETWSTGIIVILLVTSAIMPLISIIFGIIGLVKHEKKGPALAVLILSIVWWIIWMVIMLNWGNNMPERLLITFSGALPVILLSLLGVAVFLLGVKIINKKFTLSLWKINGILMSVSLLIILIKLVFGDDVIALFGLISLIGGTLFFIISLMYNAFRGYQS